MAVLYAFWKRLSHLRLDGVHYDVCGKERDDGRFTVAWVCLACCEQGPPIPAARTLEEAVSFAHIGLRAHHGLVHAKPRVPDAGSVPDPSGLCRDVVAEEKDGRQTAYEQVCAAWEKLCAAHAKMCSSNEYRSCTNVPEDLAAAYGDWNASTCNFDKALQAYSAELSRRANAIEAKLDCSNGA
jgi:hypothetical protein